MALQTKPTPYEERPHKISLDQFERMIDVGIFGPDDRIELIEGEVLDMSPSNYPHQACVARLTRLLTPAVGESAYVWPQNNSIRIPGFSRPQPDLTLLKWRDDEYSRTGVAPTADDVLLVVEVSDTSLRYDRTRKQGIYAQAGIPNYWIANLNDRIVETYSGPTGDSYQAVARYGPRQTLTLPGNIVGEIRIDDVLR